MASVAIQPAGQTSTRSASQRWWPRLLIGLIIIGALAAARPLINRAASSKANGPRLTHKISRSDLRVSVTEQGTLESSSNTEIKCRVRGGSTVLWVIEPGTMVKPGDVLVRLDTSAIEDTINQQKIAYERAVATHAQSEADVAVARIAITEYEEGTFRSQLKTLMKDLAIAESNLRTSRNMLEHAQRMFKRGYVSELEVESNAFAVQQAELELGLKKTEIDVLERFTKAKQLEELNSALKAAEAKLASDKAALDLEESRLRRAEEQLENCVIVAESAGMVIHPSAAQWKEQPDIEEGANVREDQVLLIIPDLTKMQVKVGVHESKVDRVKPGMEATIELQDMKASGRVASVASVTRPAGWWTGNVVKYDTIVEIDRVEGLKPGMSAAVEIIIAEHEDVVTIPVAAVVEHEGNAYCWVKEAGGLEKRALRLGDSNDQFIVVEAGVKEGDEVVLNPLAHVEDAQIEALRPANPGQTTDRQTVQTEETASKDSKSKQAKQHTEKPATGKNSKKSAGEQTDKKRPKLSGQVLIQLGDKNGDGVLTIDEFAQKDRPNFSKTDRNGDGQVDADELDAILQTYQKTDK